MLDPQLSEKMRLAYLRIGEIGWQLSLNMRKGKDHSAKQQALWDKGLKIWQFTKILFRHVDISVTPPVVDGLTDIQVNKIIRCLDKLTEADHLPIMPTLVRNLKPVVINKGQDGKDGAPGQDGQDATVELLPEVGESEITIREEVSGSTKRFYLNFVPYKAPTVSVEIAAPLLYSKGDSINKAITVRSTKGSSNITGITITAPSALNSAFQAVLDLPVVNGVSQPVDTTVNTVITDTTIFSASVTDGSQSGVGNNQVEFVFPMLHGAVPSLPVADYYQSLQKTIAKKGNQGFLLNGTDSYFIIGYPASYGTALIKDQNDDNVSEAFDVVVADVTSTGLTNNWTESYRLHISKLTSDITNQLYRLEF